MVVGVVPCLVAPFRTGRYADRTVGQYGVPVGISNYAPRFRLGYALAGREQALAPAWWTVRDLARRGQWPLFREYYRHRLDDLGTDGVIDVLLPYMAAGQPLVLLCFEDVHAGQLCHRRLFAEWWQERTGALVEEVGGA